MARQPGWYEDPEGLPGVHRWWDGETWTVDITTDPRTAESPDDPVTRPPPDTVATQPGPIAEPSDEPAYEDGPTTPQRPKRSGIDVPARTVRRIVYLVVILVVVVNGAKVVRAVLNIDLIPGSPDVDLPDLGLPDLDLPNLEDGPGTDGRYDGGGISYAAMEGRWTRTLLASDVPMNDLDGEETVVAMAPSGRQYALVWVGTVEPTLVESDLTTTARNFANRFAARAYPADARLDDSAAAGVTVDRTPAARVTRHYAYRVPGTPIVGEELTVLVLDTGDQPAVWVATVPDGYPAVREQAQRALRSVRVD